VYFRGSLTESITLPLQRAGISRSRHYIFFLNAHPLFYAIPNVSPTRKYPPGITGKKVKKGWKKIFPYYYIFTF
jgi:hypothetical protein